MNIRQIQEARESYGIDGWGAGYFGINDEGKVICHPTNEEHLNLPLQDAVEQARSKGAEAPLILRFPQIIESQLERMHSAFRESIWEFNYTGQHRAVFPFKVNQRREFIDHIVACGQRFDYGLEVGSKAEFIAALAYELADDALFVCNGFKDREFIDLGFIAADMGRNVIVVVEGPDELEMILERAGREGRCPGIGIRARLYSKGAGKWEKSSGESSKFGLTTLELLHCLDLIDKANLRDKLQMLHFHNGSQVTEIKRIKNATKEASRVYTKIVKMGFQPKYLNIGGGIGVDYDGSKTSFQSSANYSLQEFANDVVYVIGDVCKNEGVPVPDIVTESGRVIAAYHSVVVTNIREVQTIEQTPDVELVKRLEANANHKALTELRYVIDNINRKNYNEFYHDALEYYEELFTLFSLGYISLDDRALAENLYQGVCKRAIYYASFERHMPEEFQRLQQDMISTYLGNFSIFQSIPDAWSVDQLFPVLPLSEHHRKPTIAAKIVDITCDSDGCLERFIDRNADRRVLDLHEPMGNHPYYLGFFLAGAYQESLANEHNLFGAIDEADVIINADGAWSVTKVTEGDPIRELLECRNYDISQIQSNICVQIERAVERGTISGELAKSYLGRLETYMNSSPYLKS